ncbi:MAG TPA: NUDIX hydrolase [Gammaproteobacteria bacterium]|nr:NUDIX hydrolase [Gammaproteobacteria bacterium]
MVWKPHVTVAALAERNGHFLLVEEEIGGQRVLNQPAGHLEPGETLQQAVVRETREETGRDFQPLALVGIYRWANPESEQTFLRVCFAGTVSEPDPERELDPEILATTWLDPAAMRTDPNRLRSPMVLRCIDDHQAGRRYPLELLQDLG